jgi:hypothetical protein
LTITSAALVFSGIPVHAKLHNPGISIDYQPGDIGTLQGKLTFASMRDGNWEIYVMNADGSNQTG